MQAEGKNAVIETIKCGLKVNRVLIENGIKKDSDFNDLFEIIKEKNIEYQFVSKDTLDNKSETKRHQGYIAFMPDYIYCDIDDILLFTKKDKQGTFLVILDGITDPHNFGSILRVCECAGVHGVIISKNRSCEVNSTVLRTSAGAAGHIKIAKVVNINSTVEYLKDNNIFVFGADASGRQMDTVNLKGNIAIVIGSEGKGMHELTKKVCDEIISIPMYGKINSLNASVACGVVLYEALKQRGK